MEETNADPASIDAGRTSATKRVARNTAFQVAGDVTAKVSVFVLYAIIARALDVAGFGDYTLAVSLAFFIRISTLGTDLILTREVSRDREKVHGLFWHCVLLKLVIGVLLLAAITGYASLAGYGAELTACAALIGLSNLIDLVAFSAHAVLRGHEEMGPPAKALALEGVCLVVFGSVALLLLDGTLVALGVAYVAAAIVAILYIARVLRRRRIRPALRASGQRLGWLVRAALPLGVAAVFAGLLARSDAVILSAITRDPEVVGLYGAAYRTYEATFLVSWAFGVAIYPILSRAQSGTQSLRRIFEVGSMAISAVTFGVGGLMALFGPTITTTVFGDGFAGAGTATRILGAAVALYGIFTMSVLTLVGQDRQRFFPLVMGGALLLNVSLNFVLIPSIGLNGSAVAQVAAQGLATATTVTLALRRTGRVSASRIFGGVAMGLLAMATVWWLLGEGLIPMVAALCAYLVALLGIEWIFQRNDLTLFAGALRRRGAGSNPGADATPVVVPRP